MNNLSNCNPKRHKPQNPINFKGTQIEPFTEKKNQNTNTQRDTVDPYQLRIFEKHIDNKLENVLLFVCLYVFFFALAFILNLKEQKVDIETAPEMHSMQTRRKVCIVFAFIILKESITRSISEFQQLSQPTIKIKRVFK